MLGYIIRRILVAIVITIGIAAITFELLHLISGSPVHEVLGRGAKRAAVAAWNRQHGYDRPLPAQFLTYLGNLAHLNFGYSYKQGQSVAQLFKENAGRSIYLSGSALVLSLLIAMPLGIAQALKRNSVADYTATGLTFLLYAMPVMPDLRMGSPIRPASSSASSLARVDITATGAMLRFILRS